MIAREKTVCPSMKELILLELFLGSSLPPSYVSSRPPGRMGGTIVKGKRVVLRLTFIKVVQGENNRPISCTCQSQPSFPRQSWSNQMVGGATRGCAWVHWDVRVLCWNLSVGYRKEKKWRLQVEMCHVKSRERWIVIQCCALQ